MAEVLRGWQLDPSGGHEFRYFARNGTATRLVRDGERWSHDPPLESMAAATIDIPLSTSAGVAPPQQWGPPVSPTHFAAWEPAPVPDQQWQVHLTPPQSASTHTASAHVASTHVDTNWATPVPPDPNTSFLRRANVRRFIRYGSVSVISTAICLITLGLLVGLANVPAVWANIIATAVATGPSFELNRRWVWGHDGQRSIRRQALPYFLLSFLALVVSTIAVHVASGATMHSSRLIHTAAVELASVGASGALWLVQFVLCDRILFRPRQSPSRSDAWTEPEEQTSPEGRGFRQLESV